MSLSSRKSVTLLELIITITILTLIVVGFSTIDIFGRYHVTALDIRAKLQNEVSYVLEHMTQQISRAIGDVNNVPVVLDDPNPIGEFRRIKVYVDLAADGQSPGDGQRGTEGDQWIAYWYRDSSTPALEQYQIWYCPQCTDSTCETCNPEWGTAGNIISKKISDFSPSYTLDPDNHPVNNYIRIQLSACWDPDGSPVACDTLDNPIVTIKNRIYMPAVSTH